MKRHPTAGFSLIELMVSMVIAAIVSSFLLPGMLSFQAKTLVEIKRDDLHKRAERLLRFAVDDLRDAALLIGATPRPANGGLLTLVQDSLPGDPLVNFGAALVPESSGPAGHDALTLLKTVSFSPRIRLTRSEEPGATALLLNRRPNRPPGSSREIQPAPTALNHIVIDNHKICYRVLTADQTLQVGAGLLRPTPAGTEVLGVRAHRLYLQPFEGSNRFYRDNFTSREILDDCIDGLQLEYLMSNGSLVNAPADPTEIRAVRISLLVRSRKADPAYLDQRVYRLGDRIYGPFLDHFRRVSVSHLVEIKNHGLS